MILVKTILDKSRARALDDAVVPGLELPGSISEIKAETFLLCDFALSPRIYKTKLKRLESKVFADPILFRID